MLVITDAVTGRATDIGPAKGGLLRIAVCLGATAPARQQLEDVRALLAADTLKRVAELSATQALLGLVIPDSDETWQRALPRIMGHYGIHPPEAIGDPAKVLTALGGTPGVWVVAHGAEPPEIKSPQVAIGAVDVEGTATGDDPGDPLTTRLALLSHSFYEPLELSARELADAHTTLLSWRRQVAAWAEGASRPPSVEHVRDALSAARSDADVAQVLNVLRLVAADPNVPDGAKFETFCRLDRILGLDLPALVGSSLG